MGVAERVALCSTGHQSIQVKQIVTLVLAVDLTVIRKPGFVSDRYLCAQQC